MFSLYDCHDVGHKRRTGTKDNGAPVYAALQTVRGRFENKRKLIRDNNGEVIISNARVLTMAEVQPGDVIVFDGREWPVVSVETSIGLYGTIIYREVML